MDKAGATFIDRVHGPQFAQHCLDRADDASLFCQQQKAQGTDSLQVERF